MQGIAAAVGELAEALIANSWPSFVDNRFLGPQGDDLLRFLRVILLFSRVLGGFTLRL
jgi:hypothetical protein